MGVRPRFSVVIPVRDRADVVGRAVASVLAQTFANLEVVVVDRGSTDDTVTAARSVADHRVRIVDEPGVGEAAARTAGVRASRGRWVAVLEADDEVAPGWLARLGRTIDACDAELVSCGGDQLHPDGSLTRVLPGVLAQRGGTVDLATGDPAHRPRICMRSGAFAATRRLLVEVGAFGDDDHERHPDEVGQLMLSAALAAGRAVAHTPEPLVRWNERRSDQVPAGELLRLVWSYQGIDALARTPIPDGQLLTRYAVAGGIAAVRIGDSREARRLFRLARRLEPRELRHWARWAAALLPPVAARVWAEEPAGEADPMIAGAAAG